MEIQLWTFCLHDFSLFNLTWILFTCFLRWAFGTKRSLDTRWYFYRRQLCHQGNLWNLYKNLMFFSFLAEDYWPSSWDTTGSVSPYIVRMSSGSRLLFLVCFLALYLVLGAFIFGLIEKPREEALRVHIRTLREEFLEDNSCVTGKSIPSHIVVS